MYLNFDEWHVKIGMFSDIKEWRQQKKKLWQREVFYWYFVGKGFIRFVYILPISF